MEAQAAKKVPLNRAALIAMLTKIASNPFLLAYLTSKPDELLKEYQPLIQKERDASRS